jgi:hypothetical protein
LLQAFADVCVGKDKDRLEVVKWLGTTDFEDVCGWAEVPEEQTASTLRSVAEIQDRTKRMLWLKQMRNRIWIAPYQTPFM